jgi:hypothetical protein
MPRIVNAWKDVDSDSIFLFEEDAAAQCHEYADGYVIEYEENKFLFKFFKDYFDAEEYMAETYGGVTIGPDYIAIYDKGEELVRWVEDEWLEEPALAINLANAIHLYYTRGPEFIREKLGK